MENETSTPQDAGNGIEPVVGSGYTRKWYHFYEHCSSCFARNDQHDMNCLECCPVKNGEVEKVMYANQEELADKKYKALRDVLHG